MSADEKYIVKKNDTLSKIAKQYKVGDWKKLWNHKANRDLNKKYGGDETKIRPKDVLAIPSELSPKSAEVTVEIGKKTYTFKDEKERDKFLKTVKKVTIKGKEHVFIGKEWQDFEKEMLREIKRTAVLAAQMRVDSAETLWQHFSEMNNEDRIVSWFVSLGGSKLPPWGLIKDAKHALASLESAVGSGDFKRIHKALGDGERSINEAYNTMKRYQKDTTGRAENWVTGLTWTKTAAFTAVGIMATPVAVTAAGSVVLGGAIAGGGTALIQSTSNELGHGLAGTSKGVGAALKNVALDTFVDATVGAVMKHKKVGEFIEGCGKQLVKRAAGKWLGKIPTAAARKFVFNYMRNAGSSAVESAIEEGIRSAKGDTTVGEFFTEVGKSAALGALLHDFDKVLDKKLAPSIFYKLPRETRDKILKNVSKEEAIKTIGGVLTSSASSITENAVEQAISGLSGKEDMEKAGVTAAASAAERLAKNRDFLEKLEAAAKAQAK